MEMIWDPIRRYQLEAQTCLDKCKKEKLGLPHIFQLQGGLHFRLTRTVGLLKVLFSQFLLSKAGLLTGFWILCPRLTLFKEMARGLKDAIQITPSIATKWCVLIQVILRRKPKKKENGPLFRNYVVTDTKGTLVPIVMFNGTVAHFAHTLEPYKRYYVSNAVVKDTPTQFKSLQYPYTWTLQRKNLVEAYEEPIPPPLPCKFELDKFADFYHYADHEKPICIKALIVHTLPVQKASAKSTYRDCVVINEEMIPMLVRVWDDVDLDSDVNVYAKYKCPTLIIAYGLNVSTQNGLSLRTRTNAYFMENPPLIEEKPLKEWYDAHSVKISSMIQTHAYRNPAILFQPPRPSEILPLTFAIASIENVKAVWTEGSITFIPGQQHFWYEACEQCSTELDVDIDWKIMCLYCQEYTKVTMRYKIGVFLNHGKTTVEVFVKSPEIDKLLPFTANEVRLAAAANKPLTSQIEAALQKKHVICYLKYYDKQSQGTMHRRYPVLKIYSEAEMHEYNASQQTAALAAVASEDGTCFDHIGSSTTAPKTPANKEVYTPTIQSVIADTLEISSLLGKKQAQQSETKRKLPFGESRLTKAANQPSDKAAPDLPSTQEPTKAMEAQISDPSETTPIKKTKADNTET